MRALIAILALILPAASLAGPLRWGVEAGGNYSALDLRSTPMPNHETDSRVLPAFSVFAERRVSTRWSVTPGLRYAQQGGKSSWQDELAGGPVRAGDERHDPRGSARSALVAEHPLDRRGAPETRFRVASPGRGAGRRFPVVR